MTKTFVMSRKVQKPLGLFLWFGTFLFLFGITGCSADKHIVVSGGRTPDTGLAGPGVIDRWTWYGDFKFDSNQANLRVSDAGKVFEIAVYRSEEHTSELQSR